MREIKFRGKYLDKWLYGSLYMNESGQPAIATPAHFYFRCVDPDTVGQFTGLLDAVGREIYEGDIIRVDSPVGISIHKIVYGDDNMYLDYPAFDLYPRLVLFDGFNSVWYCHTVDETHITVIGNVYDNPELLEAAHD